MNIEQYLTGIESCNTPRELTEKYGIYFDNIFFFIRSEDPKATFEKIRSDIGAHKCLENYFLDGRDLMYGRVSFVRRDTPCSEGVISPNPHGAYKKALDLDHQLLVMFNKSLNKDFTEDDSVLAIRDMIRDFSRYFIEEGIKSILLTNHSEDADIKQGIFINTS